MRTLLIGQEPVLNVAVRVDTPVAQKRPAAPDFFDAGEIDLGEHERLVVRGFRDDHPERIAHERVAPEFDPCAPPPPPPPPPHRSTPTRFTAATQQPLAIAWLRWIVFQASSCCSPYCSFSDGCQPIAVG